MTTHFEEYCHGIYNSGVNCFWIININNSQQVLDKLHTINHFSKAKHFDFSTLFSSIPHVFLKLVLMALIQEAYHLNQVVAKILKQINS